MQNSLPIKLARGSFFLLLAFVAAFFPRLVHVPEPPYPELSLSTIATILALFMQGVIWTNIIISHYIQRSIQLHVTDGSSITTFKALGAVGRLVIWIALGLVALSTLHIEIRPLLTGLGIGGLAIALAIQNILGDLFAAISIVVDKPFVVGDSISVDNYRGKVEHIGLKTTRVRSESGEQIIFSNGELLKSKIRNYSR
ncbi:MAG TPA: mechanosensitive ion channel domain-containing protein [Gemmatimonadaceae bacterium]|jgi:small-conductance mechanosensitive channel|nr:mechanosensitive ion channel domain-containing protein [Gemmatimonadaceae bacterium]